MQYVHVVARAVVLGLLLFGWAAPNATADETCEEVLACALDTMHGQAPVSICSACGNSAAEMAEIFQKAIDDPSITSVCGAANTIAWIDSALSSGITGSVQQLICALNPEAGTIDSTACSRSCEEKCGQEAANIAAAGIPQGGGGFDPARAQEASAAAESHFNGCRLKCGCGYDKLICEQGAASLAKFVCRKIGLEGKEAPKKTAGEACDSDDECQNDACGRTTAKDDEPKVCCQSGEAKTYAGYDYCTKMANGSVCWSDAMCASGLCEGNAGGTKKGTCAPSKKEVGASCTANKECANGACARATAADNEPLTCCASGDFSTYAGFDYCTNMKSGSVCWSDAMCASEECGGNMGGFKKGKCR